MSPRTRAPPGDPGSRRPARWPRGSRAPPRTQGRGADGTAIVRYVVGHDCGNVINPLIVEGQILGGVAHGLSNALY